MELKARTEAGFTIVDVMSERIDAAGAIQFKDAVREIATRYPNDVILNLEQVTFIDSSGLGAIVAALKLMPQGQSLHLACLQPDVSKVFRMTRMDSIFTIHDSLGSLDK